MKKFFANSTDQELREDLDWYSRNIAIVAKLGQGIGAVPQAMWDAHDVIETELLDRGLLKLN